MNFKKILVALALLLGIAPTIKAQSFFEHVGITGTFSNPDGTPVNGYITIGVGKPTVANTCENPVQITAMVNQRFNVVNGIIIFGASPNSFLSTNCMTPSLPYYIQLYDNTNRLVYSDNWVLPANVGATIDIGGMSSVNYGGPLTVSIPQGVVLNPTGNQTITQPIGTTLTVNSATITALITSSLSVSTLNVGTLNTSGGASVGTSLAVGGNAVIAGRLSVQGGAQEIYICAASGGALPAGALTINVANCSASDVQDSGLAVQ